MPQIMKHAADAEGMRHSLKGFTISPYTHECIRKGARGEIKNVIPYGGR